MYIKQTKTQPASPIPPKDISRKPRLGTFSTDAFDKVKSLEMDLDFVWNDINPLLQQSKTLKKKRDQLERDIKELGQKAGKLWAKAQDLVKNGFGKEAKAVKQERFSCLARKNEFRDKLNAIRACLRPMFNELNELFEKKDRITAQIAVLDPTRVYRRHHGRQRSFSQQEQVAEKANAELKRRWLARKNGKPKASARKNEYKPRKRDFASSRKLWGESKGEFMGRLEILRTINNS